MRSFLPVIVISSLLATAAQFISPASACTRDDILACNAEAKACIKEHPELTDNQGIKVCICGAYKDCMARRGCRSTYTPECGK
jgi:hypothetical protein